jgi:hypothetical protein
MAPAEPPLASSFSALDRPHAAPDFGRHILALDHVSAKLSTQSTTAICTAWRDMAAVLT